jgi:hypothetical protein
LHIIEGCEGCGTSTRVKFRSNQYSIVVRW